MRNRAGGLLIENGKLLLIHRIKKKDGVVKEYYVVPGGGIEDGENIEAATKRELKEEIGIDVEIVGDKPLYTLEQENGNQYFSVINKISGEIGTGTGPEFSDLSYADKGVYSAEMISIQDIINGKINMVPEIVKEEFINTIKDLNMEVNNICSDDLSKENSKMISELYQNIAKNVEK